MAIFWKRFVVQGDTPFPFAALAALGPAVKFATAEDEAIANQTGLRRLVVVRDTRVVIDNSIRQMVQGSGWTLVRDTKSHPITDHDDASSLRDA